MTILDTLPPMCPRGAFALSRAPFDDPGLYGRLLAAAPASGRCPVLLAGHALASLGEGWDPGPALADVERRDAADVLARRYPSGCVYHADCLAPFGTTFPGCAPATAGRSLLRPDEVVAAAVDEAELVGEHQLALVPVSRPADVPAALGWSGMSASWDGWDDVAAVSTVLRSWEDRFGAVLVRMGRATLELSVAAPPWERSECLAIAAEHYAFCDDTYKGNPGTLRDYANLLRGACRWSFWWD
jgi:Domain of unknown function (DUF4253)